MAEHACAQQISEWTLPVESDQLILQSGPFSDADRIATKHVGRNLGWIIAGTEDDDISVGELLQQTLKIAVPRDQNDIMRGGVLQNPSIANTGKLASKRTFRLQEQVA